MLVGTPTAVAALMCQATRWVVPPGLLPDSIIMIFNISINDTIQVLTVHNSGERL